MPVDGKPGKGPRGEVSPEDRAALEQRSNELGRRLDVARQTDVGRRQERASDGRGEAMGRALRLSAELIAGVIVGSAIGWYVDRLMGNQKPYMFILFFLLGAAAGMMNVIRIAMREKTPPLPSVKDEREEDN